MEQLNISRLFDRLMRDPRTVKSANRSVGTYNFTYLLNPHLHLSALVFMPGELTTADDVKGIVIFRVSDHSKRLVEVLAAWRDTIATDLPFAATVHSFCSALFGTWVVPTHLTADIEALSIVGPKDVHLYDYITGRRVSDWKITRSGIQTEDGVAHTQLALAHTADPPPTLRHFASKNVHTFTTK